MQRSHGSREAFARLGSGPRSPPYGPGLPCPRPPGPSHLCVSTGTVALPSSPAGFTGHKTEAGPGTVFSGSCSLGWWAVQLVETPVSSLSAVKGLAFHAANVLCALLLYCLDKPAASLLLVIRPSIWTSLKLAKNISAPNFSGTYQSSQEGVIASCLVVRRPPVASRTTWKLLPPAPQTRDPAGRGGLCVLLGGAA